MRLLVVASVLLALASAFLLYGIDYDTRRLEAEVQNAERKSDAMRADIAVLKAERAHLSRPERIEPLARALGLQPPTVQQFTASADGEVASPARSRPHN